MGAVGDEAVGDEAVAMSGKHPLLVCGAGHVFDRNNPMQTLSKGWREVGGTCPEVMEYDRMNSPPTKQCRRKLKIKEIKQDTTMKRKYRIDFVDVGQDLLSVTVELYTDLPNVEGEIVAVSQGCSDSIERIYVGKLVDLKANPVGESFNYADPLKEFKVTATKWVVEAVVKVEEVVEVRGGDEEE